MAIGDYDVLARGVHALRGQPETGWHAIEDRVVAAVRATPRGGWPLLVEDPRPGVAGVIRVSDSVLGTLLGRALAGDADHRVVDLDVRSNDEALHEVSIELSGRYGADLPAAVERVAATCDAVVRDVIGPGTVVPVRVTVVDVHR